MKIWAKILYNQNIQKEIVYESYDEMTYLNYQKWVRDICLKLDIPTPIIIPYHYKNFALFHNTRFKPSDFVESIDYDQLVLEDCKVD